MKQTVYKLKKKRKGAFELPIKDLNINRIIKGKDGKEDEDLGGKKIKYIPGGKSIWADDLPENAISQKKWFVDGFLFIPNSDKNLLEICEIHPWNGVHFFLQDKQADAKKELDGLRAKDEIINLLSNSDTDKIIATSMAIFGTQAFNWDESTCELELRKYGEKNPSKLLNELNSKTYESKYIAALALGKGVVRYNLGKTKLIWNDSTEGEILKLAKGENGIAKLGELLSKRTDESEILLQAIAHKLDEKAMSIPKKADSSESEKDREIAELKKQLAAANKPKSDNKADSNLSDLQEKYKTKFEVEDVPARYRNDADWISKKLAE